MRVVFLAQYGILFMQKLLLLLVLLTLTACQIAAPAAPPDPAEVARKWLDSKGKNTVKVTKVVTGDPKYYKVDQLWCAETDGKTAEGTTYLLVVYRKGEQWITSELSGGEYEWNLNKCERK